ncbi:hypothetical protein E2R65_14660 [Mucilaginibacter phyllosphaerae]|uniref:Uncharacterized protein n=1 Tax=Mucilaginibacter phyllosphaerae TaxID=1812349 RepID=A0A4Y8AAF0_9SPHI|nr:hypothetical protein E2R65_14660 [Mucilaginibacter phyllosphaerae]
MIISDKEDEFEGIVEKWQEVMIHGDPNGLRSLARLLLELADTNQEKMKKLPIGAREHYHLFPNINTSKSSVEIILGRLDAKRTGSFYDAYIEKDKD